MAPAVETAPNLNDGLNGDNASTKPVVGIIYPPPEVRNIVDKTAAFVARNGPEFEARIRQNEINNPKFNFLNVGDPYHAYYQYKVKEIREGNPPDSTPVPAAPQAPARPVLGPPPSVPATQFQKQQEILKQVQQDIPQVPKEPPPEFEFIVDPPSISAMELDIVKLTAQFVARNGRQFLTSLMNREARNYQFDFLRPQHSLFQYFTRLLEQYTKVLIPPKDLMGKLREESSNSSIVLEQVKKRADWQRHQEAKKRREEEIAERERISYAQIDWHDFVVVETVDYQPFELGNFPPPTNPESVGARVLLQERYEDGQDVEMQLESDEEGAKEAEESESEEEEAPVRPAAPPPPPPPAKPAEMAPPPLPPAPENVIVRKDYNPKAAPRPQARPPAPDEYLISPITGERIPASQVAEHMRIGLLDPRWVEQRDRQLQEKMAQESVYAPGSAIESSLRQLAERRTDIFGVGAEETAIGKKIGEEERRRDDKPWEGPTADAAQRNTISIQDQIAQIHKSKGLVSEDQQRIGPKSSDDENKPGVVASAPPKPPSATPAAPLPPPPAPVMNIPRPVAAPTVILAPQPPIMMVPIAPPAPIVVAPSPFGFVPQQPMGVQPAPPVMQVTHVQHVAPEPVHHGEGEPPAKRVRSEDQLMPEEAFLVRYPGPLKFHVAVPLVNDKSGWKLQGQQLNYSLPPTETIASVKAKIQEATGLPPAKQKLVWEGLYFKDQFSLAYYNVMPDGVIQLQVKERGGRKK